MVICCNNRKLMQSLGFLIYQMEIMILDLPILCGFDEDSMFCVLMLALNAIPSNTPHLNYDAGTGLICPRRLSSRFPRSELCSVSSKK